MLLYPYPLFAFIYILLQVILEKPHFFIMLTPIIQGQYLVVFSGPVYFAYSLNPELPLYQNPIYNWILQYHGMLSTTDPAVAFYQSLLAAPHLLANGYELVKQFLFASSQNRSQTLLSLLHPQVPVLMLVLNIYPTEVFSSPQVPAEEKQETRKFLTNLLTSELLKIDAAYNPKAVELLFSFLHKIHNVEGFHEWVAHYEQTLERLVENQSSRFGFFLLSLFREADDRVGEFAQHILGLVVGSDWVPNAEEQLEILYYCFRSLAMLNETDPDSIQTYVSQHIEPTIAYISQHMRVSVRTMKFSLKILTLLFGDYQVPCSKELLQGVESTGRALIEEYINYLNRGNGNANTDIELEEQEGDTDPIEIALYQLLELFLTLFGNEAKLNIDLAVYLCLASTFLSQQQCLQYTGHSDQYVAELQDEGEASLRNKAVFFMQEMLQNEKQGKKCKKMLQQYVQEVLTNPTALPIKVTNFLNAYNLPATLLAFPQLYQESALLVLYSFTDELAQNDKQISTILAAVVQNSPANSIEAIMAVTVLNKLVKKQEGFKAEYLIFLRGVSRKFAANIGMLIVLMRGFYSFSSEQQLTIAEDGNAVPFHLVQTLLGYLSGNDSAQLESGFLILEFLLHLLKRSENRAILLQLAPTQTQLYLLKTYINDGITCQLIIDLIAALADPTAINAVLTEVAHGHANDQSLPSLVGKCVASRAIALSEEQLLELCGIYGKRLEVISDIIVAFLELAKPHSQKLISVLNSQLSPRWMAHLIRYELLFNLEEVFLNCIRNITVNITSPAELENQLVLPYSLILRNPQQVLSLLAHHQLLHPFCNKLLDYARLFKGTHLRITTLNVFAAIAAVHGEWIRKTVELNDSYGAIESNEWEDEYGEEDEERIISRYFADVVNEEVEKTFKTTFGELAWDSQQVNARIAHLRQMI